MTGLCQALTLPVQRSGKEGVATAIRHAQRPSEWPVSDQLATLLERVQQLEHAISARFKTLESMAKAVGYDRRLLKAHRHQLQGLARGLLALLECSVGSETSVQPTPNSGPELTVPMLEVQLSARRRSAPKHDGQN